jgi:hypothetical protein
MGWKRGGAVAVLVAVLGTAGPVAADNNPNGIVFRALGWYKGKAEISENTIRCEIPTTSSAIADAGFSLGLWNTFGATTLGFPDINNPFGNPCGGWLQLQNNLLDQGIQVEAVRFQYKVVRARRFRQLVPTARGFPIACRHLRRQTLFTGLRLNPVNTTEPVSGSGAPNVAFAQMLPVLSPEMVHCLRAEYAGRASSAFTSLMVVARATAIGRSDSGDVFRSNTVPYTVTLRHTCGNGRVDDGEVCDPLAPNSCIGLCNTANGTCSQSESLSCTTDAECAGTCMPPDDPSECLCVY